MIEINKKKAITLSDEIRLNGKRIEEVWVDNKQVYPESGEFVKFRGSLKGTFSYNYPAYRKSESDGWMFYLYHSSEYNPEFRVDIRYVGICKSRPGIKYKLNRKNSIKVSTLYGHGSTYSYATMDSQNIGCSNNAINLTMGPNFETPSKKTIEILGGDTYDINIYLSIKLFPFLSRVCQYDVFEPLAVTWDYNNYMLSDVTSISLFNSKLFKLNNTNFISRQDNNYGRYFEVTGTNVDGKYVYPFSIDYSDQDSVGLKHSDIYSNFYINLEKGCVTFGPVRFGAIEENIIENVNIGFPTGFPFFGEGTVVYDTKEVKGKTVYMMPINVPITKILYIGDYDKAPKKMRTLRESDLDF